MECWRFGGPQLFSETSQPYSSDLCDSGDSVRRIFGVNDLYADQALDSANQNLDGGHRAYVRIADDEDGEGGGGHDRASALEGRQLFPEGVLGVHDELIGATIHRRGGFETGLENRSDFLFFDRVRDEFSATLPFG